MVSLLKSESVVTSLLAFLRLRSRCNIQLGRKKISGELLQLEEVRIAAFLFIVCRHLQREVCGCLGSHGVRCYRYLIIAGHNLKYALATTNGADCVESKHLATHLGKRSEENDVESKHLNHKSEERESKKRFFEEITDIAESFNWKATAASKSQH